MAINQGSEFLHDEPRFISQKYLKISLAFAATFLSVSSMFGSPRISSKPSKIFLKTRIYF